MDIIQAIKERRSVRSYLPTPLSAEQRRELTEFADTVPNPIGGKFTIRLKQFDLQGDFKPSTYGIIQGAQDYFLMAIADDETSKLAAGFCFEQIVLRACELGLGTCWIGGTFKGTTFSGGEPWPEAETLKIVCPVGLPSKPRLIERLSRFTMRSDHRKPWDSLFFEGDFSHPLPRTTPFRESLEMLRLAPSSTNSQPWRILVEGSDVHLYCQSKNALSPLDCGIALAHLYLTETHLGHQGQILKTATPLPHSTYKYLLTYRRK